MVISEIVLCISQPDRVGQQSATERISFFKKARPLNFQLFGNWGALENDVHFRDVLIHVLSPTP